VLQVYVVELDSLVLEDLLELEDHLDFLELVILITLFCI